MKRKTKKGGSNVLNRTTHLYKQHLKRHSNKNTTPFNSSKKKTSEKGKNRC